MAVELGARAEDVVAKYLAAQRFKILARNVRYPYGEIDLVAMDGDILVFVEVKYRRSTKFASPFEAVTSAKQKKIIRAAQAYLQKFKSEPVCRFDVIAVSGDLAAPHFEHLRDAFWLEEI